MILQVPKFLFVALVSQVILPFASAAVEVFTSLADWEARVASVEGPPCISIDEFSGPDILLVENGLTDVGLFDVTVDSIEPAFVGILGQNGGVFTGYLSENGPTTFDIHNIEYAPVIGFAGYWVSTATNAMLTVTINAETFRFDTFLGGYPGTGTGFLGFIDESGISMLEFGTVQQPTTLGETFQLDNARVAGRCHPCPPAGCLPW